MGKPEHSDHQATISSDAPPPPYTEGPRPESSTSSNINPLTKVNSPYQPFPPVLYAHYQMKIFTTVFHLGDETNKKLFAVSVHTGWTGKGPGRPGTILHNGPTDKDPMFAAAGEEFGEPGSTISPNSAITLPPLSAGAPGGRCTEIMRSTTSQGTAVFRFTIEVQQGDGSLQRENFEWRKCKGEEAKIIDPPWKTGFKLVRLSHRPSSSVGEKSQEVTSEGLEVVATFFWNDSWSLMDPFKLEFMGSGRTGALGDRFALMTIITGLRLQWLRIQSRTNERNIQRGEARFVPGA